MLSCARLALASWREINAPDQSRETIGNEESVRRDQTAAVQAAGFLWKCQHQFRLGGRVGSPTAQIESVQIGLMRRVGVSCTDIEYIWFVLDDARHKFIEGVKEHGVYLGTLTRGRNIPKLLSRCDGYEDGVVMPDCQVFQEKMRKERCSHGQLGLMRDVGFHQCLQKLNSRRSGRRPRRYVWDQIGMLGAVKITSGKGRNRWKGIIRFDWPERPEGAIKRSGLVGPFDRSEAFHPVNHNAKRQSHIAHLTVVLRLQAFTQPLR
jgi:hypothetical protein